MTIDLTGKTALITGGASGIGAAIATRFASRGADVVIADIAADGGQVAAQLGATFVPTDVADLQANRDMVAAAVAAHGRLDIVVLNAGIGEGGDYLQAFDPGLYRNLVAVNLDGVVYGLHAALEVLRRQGSGSIIATSSLAGIASSPINPLYAATKHAVIGLVRSVAPSLIQRGITVNALCPTFVDTPILGNAVPYLNRLGLAVLPTDRVADVAEVILAGGETGQAWPVVPHGEPAPFAFPDLPTLMADANQPFPGASE